MSLLARDVREIGFVVSMMQIIFGSALGFIIGQGVLYGLQRSMASFRGSAFLAGFIKYAGVVATAAALITLGVWTVGDYLGARSARSVARANVSDLPAVAAIPAAEDGPDEAAGQAAASRTNASKQTPADAIDPYADSEFKVHRRPHRAGTPLSLKETLLQRSEAKARADLLKQIQQHMDRSQYDCEAAERANKYLKADLDVWGFATWQVKYFPTDDYQGATLPQCRDIQSVVDPSVALAANHRG